MTKIRVWLVIGMLMVAPLVAGTKKPPKAKKAQARPTVFKSQDRECPQNKPLGEKNTRQ